MFSAFPSRAIPLLIRARPKPNEKQCLLFFTPYKKRYENELPSPPGEGMSEAFVFFFIRSEKEKKNGAEGDEVDERNFGARALVCIEFEAYPEPKILNAAELRKRSRM